MKTLAALFWDKVDTSGDCWHWTASLGSSGYGQFGINRGDFRKTYKAHRVAYEMARGPIPVGLVLDHLCENRPCVNPWHLEPVTQKENLRRAPRHNGNKTHCPQGHEYSDKNTYWKPRGDRTCRTCHRDRERKRHAARG